MMASEFEDTGVEPETSLVGDGILRTQLGWFPVRALKRGAGGLNLSFRIDARNDVPPDSIDVAILAKAKVLLAELSNWDRHDNRKCSPDKPQLSLYCAMIKATMLESGGIHHRRPAMQIVRAVVDARTEGRGYEHRLRDYNNDPRTTLANVQALLDDATAKAQGVQPKDPLD